MNHIGEKIKQIRKERGYTQKELAELCEIATITLRQYESGKRTPSMSMFKKLSDALKVDIFDLLTFGTEPLTEEQEKELEQNDKELEELEHLHLQGYDVFMSDAEVRTRKAFSKLNSKGQEKAAEQVELLAKIPEYRKKNDAPVLNSAHQRTDIEIPTDADTSDNDIMNNPDEWN